MSNANLGSCSVGTTLLSRNETKIYVFMVEKISYNLSSFGKALKIIFSFVQDWFQHSFIEVYYPGKQLVKNFRMLASLFEM